MELSVNIKDLQATTLAWPHPGYAFAKDLDHLVVLHHDNQLYR